MAVVEEYAPGDKMRPKKNSSTIYLPVTLEANVVEAVIASPCCLVLAQVRCSGYYLPLES